MNNPNVILSISLNSDCCCAYSQAVYYESGSYFHLYDGLQGLGFAWIVMQLISSV